MLSLRNSDELDGAGDLSETKRQFRLIAMSFLVLSVAGLLTSIFYAYGFYVFFWVGLGGAVTSATFIVLARQMQGQVESWIRIVGALQFIYVLFSLWQTSLPRESRLDWIWIFPWNLAALGGVLAALACYLAKREYSRN